MYQSQHAGEIVELSAQDVEEVAGGIAPLVLVYVASSGLLTGAGIYLATEYLT